MSRDCGARLFAIHSDWGWHPMRKHSQYHSLTGITWEGCRQLAFAEGVFPDLNEYIRKFHVIVTESGRRKHVLIECTMGHKLLLMFDSTGDTTSEVHLGSVQLDINFLGHGKNYPAFLNGMFNAKSNTELETAIDKWMNPSTVDYNTLQHTAVKTFSSVTKLLGHPDAFHIVARIYAIVLLAFNNLMIKQSRKEITFMKVFTD
jgi:hypothetical protein